MGNWSGAKSAAVTVTQQQIAHLYRGYLHSSWFTPSSHITPPLPIVFRMPPPLQVNPSDSSVTDGNGYFHLAECRVTLSHVFWRVSECLTNN